MRTHANIVDRDKGYAELVQRILAKDNPTLSVGVFQNAGQVSYGTSASGKTVTVLDVALWNEFGTYNQDGSTHIPPRPFIRLYFDGQAARIKQMATVAIRQVITQKLTKREALERLGMKLAGEIQTAIGVGYFGAYPENAPRTIAKKGSATPLVDTGQLRSSITYKVDLAWKSFT